MSLRDQERPPDRIAVQEWRLLIAALAGPRRIVAGGRHRSVAIPNVNEAVLVASNAQTPALFVSVRSTLPNVGQQLVIFGPNPALSIAASPATDLAATPFSFDQVLVAGERLFIARIGGIPLTVLVSEVFV